MDVDLVDLVAIGGSNRPAECAAQDGVVQMLPFGGGHLFRVGEAWNMAIRVEHDRAGDNRPGEASTPDLVHACHAYEPETPTGIFERAHRACADHRDPPPA